MSHETDTPTTLIFLGPPTSAKSTAAKHFSPLLQAQLLKGADILPDESKHYESGRELIPDSQFLPALCAFLTSLANTNLVLDNIPRTLDQTDLLILWSETFNRTLTIINLQLTLEQVLRRADGREICPRCGETFNPEVKPSPTPGFCPNDKSPLTRRPGDNPQTIAKGYADHMQKDVPILETLRLHKTAVFDINANGPVTGMLENISHTLHKHELLIASAHSQAPAPQIPNSPAQYHNT